MPCVAEYLITCACQAPSVVMSHQNVQVPFESVRNTSGPNRNRPVTRSRPASISGCRARSFAIAALAAVSTRSPRNARNSPGRRPTAAACRGVSVAPLAACLVRAASRWPTNSGAAALSSPPATAESSPPTVPSAIERAPFAAVLLPPRASAWTARYDKEGRLLSTTDAKGQRIDYALDELGRNYLKNYICTGCQDIDVTS